MLGARAPKLRSSLDLNLKRQPVSAHGLPAACWISCSREVRGVRRVDHRRGRRRACGGWEVGFECLERALQNTVQV